MKPKYCANCKSETMHYKDMCIKCAKREVPQLPPGWNELFKIKKN